MLRVESRTHQQTPAILESNLNPRVARYARSWRCGHQFYFHELRCLAALRLSRRGCLPQALFPSKEMWRTQPAFAAKRRHTLPTPHLLGNQLSPLPAHFLASLLSRHPATLLHPHSPSQAALHVALTKYLP
jgi:hypothetical protein